MKYFVVIILMFSSFNVWTNDSVCPAIGANINFRQADEVYDFLSSHPVEKDEFETTAQFEKRRGQIYAKLSEKSIMTIKNNWYFSKFGGDGTPEYDADNQRFVMDGFICENTDENGDYIIFPECGRDIKNKFICGDNRGNSLSGADFSCSADVKNKDLGTYEAQNAFGASVTVEKRASIHHEILWNMKPSQGSKLSYSGTPFYIDVPIEKAKTLKDKLQIGFVVTLKEPFFLSDVMQSPPTRDLPIDSLMRINQIVVKLLCIVITDENNQVLKAFEPYIIKQESAEDRRKRLEKIEQQQAKRAQQEREFQETEDQLNRIFDVLDSVYE